MGRRLFRGTPGTELTESFDGVRDMTPARFDILFLIHRYRVIVQRDIRKALGLCRQTISKAVQRLIELGLVEEQVDGALDRRCKPIQLTAEGMRRFRRALHVVFSGRKIARHMREFAARFVGGPPNGRAGRIDDSLENLWSSARVLAQHLGDRSEVVHCLRWDNDGTDRSVFGAWRRERAVSPDPEELGD